VTTSSEWQLKINATLDSTDLVSGSDKAQAAVKDMATQVDTSSEAMNQSLKSVDDGVNSTFGAGGVFDTAASHITTSSSKFKKVGSAVGSEFASALTQGATSGDIAGSIISSLSSLTAGLGVAGLGVGAGVALIVGMIKGAEKKRADFVKSMEDLFLSIEVKAGESGSEIRDALIEKLTFRKVLTDFGGSFAAGFDKVTAAADELGVNMSDVLDIMQGDITPQNEYVLKLLREQAQQTTTVTDQRGTEREILSQSAQRARDILGYADGTETKLRNSVKWGKAQADDMGRTASNAWSAARAQKEMAGWAEATEARLQGVNNKLDSMLNYYNGLPGGGT
jgi:hypothetical protein